MVMVRVTGGLYSLTYYAANGAKVKIEHQNRRSCFQLANKPSSGNHWAVESEIFWKARGECG
jgi:hypothetical protein